MSSTTLRPHDEDAMSSCSDRTTLVRPTQDNPFLKKIDESQASVTTGKNLEKLPDHITEKWTTKKNEIKKKRREESPCEGEYYCTLFSPDILLIRKRKNAAAREPLILKLTKGESGWNSETVHKPQEVEKVNRSPSPVYDYNFHEDRWHGSAPFHPWHTYSTRLRTKRDWNQAEVSPPPEASKIFKSRALHSDFKQAERQELLRTWESVRHSTVHSREQQGNLYKSLFNVLYLKSSHDSCLSGFKIPRKRNDDDGKWDQDTKCSSVHRRKDSDSLISVNYPLASGRFQGFDGAKTDGNVCSSFQVIPSKPIVRNRRFFEEDKQSLTQSTSGESSCVSSGGIKIGLDIESTICSKPGSLPKDEKSPVDDFGYGTSNSTDLECSESRAINHEAKKCKHNPSCLNLPLMLQPTSNSCKAQLATTNYVQIFNKIIDNGGFVGGGGMSTELDLDDLDILITTVAEDDFLPVPVDGPLLPLTLPRKFLAA
jgi:hypothetical protein